jgi:hypothetical protein
VDGRHDPQGAREARARREPIHNYDVVFVDGDRELHMLQSMVRKRGEGAKLARAAAKKAAGPEQAGAFGSSEEDEDPSDSFFTIHTGNSSMETLDGIMPFEVIIQRQMRGTGVNVFAKNPAARVYKRRLTKPKMKRLLGADDAAILTDKASDPKNLKRVGGYLVAMVQLQRDKKDVRKEVLVIEETRHPNREKVRSARRRRWCARRSPRGARRGWRCRPRSRRTRRTGRSRAG